MPMNKGKSFRARALADKPKMYELLTTPPDGKNAYYYIILKPSMEEEFKASLLRNGKMPLEKYGTIIASGFGEPIKEELEKLKRYYKIKEY